MNTAESITFGLRQQLAAGDTKAALRNLEGGLWLLRHLLSWTIPAPPSTATITGLPVSSPPPQRLNRWLDRKSREQTNK
jgi:hypothetical protein